ncbi:MAG: hypothetical protein LBD93_11060 [Treponema sp.]|jgi:hypothetical protein|nr:hypothetical protein [Treponema sp.]
MRASLLRKESLTQVSSQEQLFNYIKVANPSIWIVLGALFILLASVVIWAATATIPIMVSSTALAEASGDYVCFLPVEQGADLKVGMTVHLAGLPAQINDILYAPLSRDNASETLSNDYAASVLGLADWNMRVMIRITDESITPEGHNLGGFVFVPVIFTIERVHPFDFIFN